MQLLVGIKMRKQKEPITSTVADVIKFCRDNGMRKQDVAKHLQISDNRIRAICSKYKIYGWPIGAASHNQTGIANPNYGGGNSRGTIGRTTKRILKIAGKNLFKCERCGIEREIELPRHHKDRNRKNNALENLEILCVSCHNKEHMSEKLRVQGKFL